jgi:hypothetical protein
MFDVTNKVIAYVNTEATAKTYADSGTVYIPGNWEARNNAFYGGLDPAPGTKKTLKITFIDGTTQSSLEGDAVANAINYKPATTTTATTTAAGATTTAATATTTTANTLRPDQIPAFTADQIKDFKFALNATQQAALTPKQLGDLHALGVDTTAITQSQISALMLWTSDQVSGLTPESIISVSTDKIKLLTPAQIPLIPVNVIPKLTSDQIKAFSAAQIAALTPTK